MSFSKDGASMRARWKPSVRVWLYLLRAHIGPFILAFVVTMFVFLLQFLMRFIDQIVGKGLGIWTIVQLIALNLAWMVVLAVPMAGLVASLMAFGSLTGNQETTAMKAAGISFMRMLFPIIIASCGMAVLDLWFNNQVLPDANHRAKDLMSDIQHKKPTFVVRQGEFTDPGALPGYAILARKTFPNSNNLEGVVIYDHTTPGQTQVITAKSATFSFTRDFSHLIMNLHHGEFQKSPINPKDQYQSGAFTSFQVRIPTSGYDFLKDQNSERGDRELSAKDLMIRVRDREKIAARQLASLHGLLTRFSKSIVSPTPDQIITIKTPHGPPHPEFGGRFRQKIFEISSIASQTYATILDAGSYMVEVHKKYALPVACIVFVLVGAPLGALAKRGGIGIGVGFSIGFFILYWACLIGGEKLADRGIIAPWVGMWIANIILGVLGIYMIFRVMRELPGFGISFMPLIHRLRK